MKFIDRLQHAWNAFMNRDPPYSKYKYFDLGPGYSYNPDKMRFSKGNERNVVTAVYNRIAIDCASVDIRHVLLDDKGRYKEDVNSGLNNCLQIEANKDQTARAFIQDAVQSMFDEGCIALVPIDTDNEPEADVSIDILSMRVGKILQWYPDHIQVEVYNDRKGIKETIYAEKASVAIIENPLYSIMNDRNSTLQRLVRKMNILDAIDEETGSGRLNMIIQLPYVVKTEARKEQARQRTRDIEEQLGMSKYGVAYTDGTEKVIQLNRPLENNMLASVQYLTSMLFSQLGLTQSIMDGTADEKTMNNYMKRTIEPIVAAFVDEMKRKFLSKDERDAKQTIMYFNNTFKLLPLTTYAELIDKLINDEVITSNEARQIIGMAPSTDPRADELLNKNINPISKDPKFKTETEQHTSSEGENQNG